MSLSDLHPTLKLLAEQIQPFSAVVAPGLPYETTGFMLNLDDSNLKSGPGFFSIARRATVPFSDNTYFSAAPMPTAEHKKLLEEFEAALLRERPPRQEN